MDVQDVIKIIKLPAETNSKVRFQVLTAPDIAWEMGTNPILDKVTKLIILPSMVFGERVCIQVNRMIVI